MIKIKLPSWSEKDDWTDFEKVFLNFFRHCIIEGGLRYSYNINAQDMCCLLRKSKHDSRGLDKLRRVLWIGEEDWNRVVQIHPDIIKNLRPGYSPYQHYETEISDPKAIALHYYVIAAMKHSPGMVSDEVKLYEDKWEDQVLNRKVLRELGIVTRA